VQDHHVADPVKRTGEIGSTGRQAEEERLAQRAAAQCKEKGRQGNPAERRMADTWKAEDEQNAREGGLRVVEDA
jgi:hypothetical protein